ncbi:ATP synthase subunit b [Commensalibacter sp. Nvir]|uniref:F0F1 ATP synthase subunit B family protein n=1 Tax=Commensalibacter sp. Nvir TaxID=3069817 RepID=UPI002D3DD6C4|nr:ATP synthase subunit b [Commensalibacter sp. Nvir]
MRRFSAHSIHLLASLITGGSFGIAFAFTVSSNALAAGMPQMEFSNPLVTAQFIWVLVIFFILFLFVKFFSIPQVEHILNNRQSKINEDMVSARNAKAQADKAVQALDKTRHQASIEAQAKIDSILQESRQNSVKLMQDMQDTLNKEIQESETHIEEAQKLSLAHIDQVAADVANTIIRRLLNEETDQQLLKEKINKAVSFNL